MRKGERVAFPASGKVHEVLEVGVLTASGQRPTDVLRAGEVGYLHGAITVSYTHLTLPTKA